MNMTLIEKLLSYSPDDKRRWELGDDTIIDKHLPNHVRHILINKKGNRKSNPNTVRFFSEVTILNHFAPTIKDGIVWYSSFKWLTKDRWLYGRVEGEYKYNFYCDVIKYIGFERLSILQKKAMIYREYDAGKRLGITDGGKVRFPVAPDIWFMAKDGTLYFIEGKHNESFEPTQLVGLALLKKYVNSNVDVFRIYPTTISPPTPMDYSREFSEVYSEV